MSDIYKLNKTKEDIEALLSEHKGLVYYMLFKMELLGNQDAESAAWEALWDAINTFNVYTTTQFSTYACTVIKNAVLTSLRKQKTNVEIVALVESNLHNCFTFQDTDTELFAFVEKCFNEFIVAKKDTTRNVLLFWYSSLFASSVSSIATACKCTPSYVCRVQDSFRAFMSGKLAKL